MPQKFKGQDRPILVKFVLKVDLNLQQKVETLFSLDRGSNHSAVIILLRRKCKSVSKDSYLANESIFHVLLLLQSSTNTALFKAI
jgi:hypothetical protein